jgi:hypothetical protein
LAVRYEEEAGTYSGVCVLAQFEICKHLRVETSIFESGDWPDLFRTLSGDSEVTVDFEVFTHLRSMLFGFAEEVGLEFWQRRSDCVWDVSEIKI